MSDGSIPQAARSLSVGGCSLWTFERFADERGILTPIEFNNLPFQPARIFFVHHTPTDVWRGGHAHRLCHQFMVAIRGSINVVVDNGVLAEQVTLDDPSTGLLVPPEVWSSQYNFLPGSVLAVFASDPYEPDDYHHDYDVFYQSKFSQYAPKQQP